MKKVAIIMGSDSDFPVVSKAVSKLKEFGVEYEVHVMSAHRTPDAAIKFSAEAKKNGFGVIMPQQVWRHISQVFLRQKQPFL